MLEEQGISLKEFGGRVVLSKERFDVSVSLKENLLNLDALEDSRHHPELDIPKLQRDLDTRSDKNILAELDAGEIPLWKKIEEIRNAEIGKEEAERIIVIQEVLGKAPELVNEIVEGLISFQETRMVRLNVEPRKVNAGVNHAREVMNLTRDPFSENPDGLLTMFASIHDIVKYDGDEVYLGMHEAASAALAGEVMKVALNVESVKAKLLEGGIDESKYGEHVDAVAKFAEIVIASHGEQEFPKNMSLATGQAIDADRGLYRLFGNQLYVDCFRKTEDVVAGDTDAETVGKLNRIKEGLREADMTLGISLDSFVKYHQEVNAKKLVEDYETSEEYIMTFVPNLVEYHRDMPEATGVKENYAERYRLEDGVMFAVVKAVHDPEKAKNYKKMFEEAFGERGKGIIKRAEDMKMIFDNKIQLINGSDADPNKPAEFFKDTHVAAFMRLVREIKAIAPGDLEKIEKGEGELGAEIKKVLQKMEEELGGVKEPSNE